MKKLYFTGIFISLLIFVSCQSDQETKKDHKITKKEVRQKLEKANKHLVKVEDQNIRDYIQRYNFQMDETGSGLFYQIYQVSNGEQARKGKIAVLDYSISLLDGNTIYRSDEDGIKEFKIGSGGVESGLEEGILLMKVGERARFVIPSHLAFGLLGDLNKIPEKSTIVYDIELKELKDK